MATESDALIRHIAAQRRVIAADLDRLQASLRASVRDTTDPRLLIIRHPVATMLAFLVIALAAGLLIGRRTGG